MSQACVIPLPERCDVCGLRKTTPQDWDKYQEGEGAHICWGPAMLCTSGYDIRLRATGWDVEA